MEKQRSQQEKNGGLSKKRIQHMAVHDGFRRESFVPHFLKKIHTFLSAMHDIAKRIIIQKVNFFI
jgi:hypothetical protein